MGRYQTNRGGIYFVRVIVLSTREKRGIKLKRARYAGLIILPPTCVTDKKRANARQQKLLPACFH